jgi:hypothetical protein
MLTLGGAIVIGFLLSRCAFCTSRGSARGKPRRKERGVRVPNVDEDALEVENNLPAHCSLKTSTKRDATQEKDPAVTTQAVPVEHVVERTVHFL